jgi:uncharacterized protein (UPF0335 family)
LNLTNESVLNRLSELLLSEVNNPVEQLQTEIRESKQEVEQRYKENAGNSWYHAQRIEKRSIYNEFSDSYSIQETMVERKDLRFSDIPAFAEFHHVNAKTVQDVLEGKSKEFISGRDKTIWRGYPFMFVDRSNHIANLKEDQLETQEFIDRIERKNQRKKQAVSDNAKVLPTLSDFIQEPVQPAIKR